MRRREKALTTRVVSAPGFEVVPVVARALLTIGEDHRAWSGRPYAVRPGTIVRLHPPPDATDMQVEELRAALLAIEGVVIKDVPRRRARVVLEPTKEVPAEGARQAAMQLVEAAATSDRAALRAAVEEALGAGGL